MKHLGIIKVQLAVVILLLFSTSVFAQWEQQTSGTTQDFWAMQFVNQDVGYAGGGPWQFTSTAVFSKTVDGGETWEVQNPVTFPSCIFGINALNTDTVFAVGCNASYYYGLILRSFDGGESWTSTNISNTWGFYCIEFLTNTIGYTCGWNGRIYKTEDTGETWTLLTSGSSQTFRRMQFLDENIGFAACGSDHATTNKIYKTTDGDSWDLISNFGSSFIIGGMHFFDENTAVAVGTASGKAAIMRTTDGGENWEDVLTDNYSFVLESISFNGENGWAAGKYGSANGILQSKDMGQTWELNYSELPSTPYALAQIDTLAYIAGTSGMILKHNGDITTTNAPKQNNKHIAYLNKANSMLTVDLSGFTNQAFFEIYNTNGELVKQGKGNKTKQTININNWLPGIYIVKAWDSNNQFSTKILIN